MAIQSTMIKLFIILSLCGLITARSKSNIYFPLQQLSVDEQLSEENLYNNLKYPSVNEQNIISDWPYPRVIIPSATLQQQQQQQMHQQEQFNDLNNFDGQLEQQFASRIFNNRQPGAAEIERQRELIQQEIFQQENIPEPLPTPAPLKVQIPVRKNSNAVQKEKKNNYYMSLCHFKICNMGRKRNTRYLHLLDGIDNLRGPIDNRAAM